METVTLTSVLATYTMGVAVFFCVFTIIMQQAGEQNGPSMAATVALLWPCAVPLCVLVFGFVWLADIRQRVIRKKNEKRYRDREET